MLEGTYSGVVVGATTCESSAKKTPQIAIHIQVEHVANAAGEWEKIQPEQRTAYLALTDAAWGYTQEKLNRLAFNGDFDAPEFTREPALFECRHDTYEGKTREKWDLAGGGTGAPDKAASDVIRKLNSRWKAAAAARPAAGPAAKAPPPPPPPENTGDAKNAAWSEFCKHCPAPRWNPESIEKEWFRILVEMFPGKKTSQLTAAEWAEVQAEGPAKIIPF